MYYNNSNNERFNGGFLGPFILGGITGGILAPAFYPKPAYYPPRPIYYQPVYYPSRPYPSYYPYYRK